jgi:hypothetical protein
MTRYPRTGRPNFGVGLDVPHSQLVGRYSRQLPRYWKYYSDDWDDYHYLTKYQKVMRYKYQIGTLLIVCFIFGVFISELNIPWSLFFDSP